MEGEQRWDDVYREALLALKSQGVKAIPTRGSTIEIIGKTLSLSNGQDRLLLGHPVFDPIPSTGHLLWILAGRMDLEMIRYYNPAAARFSVDRTKLHGAYGPRLFGIGVFDQINKAIELLRERPTTRRAVATVYSPDFDSSRQREEDREDEVPCTVALQWLPRGGKLNAVTFMRSQDVLRLLPLDLFVFTVIQEYVARSVGLEVGSYVHIAGSFHAYEKDLHRIEPFLRNSPQYGPLMPRMPPGKQQGYLNAVLSLEERIRSEAVSVSDGRAAFHANRFIRESKKLPDYWALMVHSLLAWAAAVLEQEKIAQSLLQVMHPSFLPFLRRIIERNSPQAALESYREVER